MDRPLQKGQRGDDVKALQRALNARKRGRHIAEDGVFGASTVAAVKQLQSRLHFPVTGIVDSKTEAAMRLRVAIVRSTMTVPVAGVSSEGSPAAPTGAGAAGAAGGQLKPPPPKPPAASNSTGAGIVHQISAGGQASITPWAGGGAAPVWSGAVSYALVYRTASSGSHLELALSPQLAINSRIQSSDPRWGLQLNGQITYADLVAYDKMHWISPFIQAGVGLSLGPGASAGAGFAVGNQLSFELQPDKLSINLQGALAAQWNNIGTPTASFSVAVQGAIGVTVQF